MYLLPFSLTLQSICAANVHVAVCNIMYIRVHACWHQYTSLLEDVAVMPLSCDLNCAFCKLPYTGKFSRYVIFANGVQTKFSRFYFRECQVLAGFIFSRIPPTYLNCWLLFCYQGKYPGGLRRTAMPSFSIESCVRGYHVYKATWSASVGEILFCQREERNVEDPFAVSIVRNGVIVGHVPRKISCVCSIYWSSALMGSRSGLLFRANSILLQ